MICSPPYLLLLENTLENLYIAGSIRVDVNRLELYAEL